MGCEEFMWGPRQGSSGHRGLSLPRRGQGQLTGMPHTGALGGSPKGQPSVMAPGKPTGTPSLSAWEA